MPRILVGLLIWWFPTASSAWSPNLVDTYTKCFKPVTLLQKQTTVSAATIMACGWLQLTMLTTLTKPCNALDLNCPQSFSTATLGIQNIRNDDQDKTFVTSRFAGRPLRQSIQGMCNINANLLSESTATDLAMNESIQGLIFLPSSTSSRSPSSLEAQDYSLVITVSGADQTVPLLFGAKIPMSQIQGFPISFSLGKNNKLADDQFQTNSDLYITAKICPSEASLPCKNSESLFQGRGISKMLVLPVGEDMEMEVRAATSIRLSQSLVPDVLFSW